MAITEFRGKRIDTEKWVYGDLNHYHRGNSVYVAQHQVDSETVGQYTGLKDKNGVKIFEGDIVKTKRGRVGKISFSAGTFGMEDEDMFDDEFGKFSEMVEVIGNIHDNPELLGREKKER